MAFQRRIILVSLTLLLLPVASWCQQIVFEAPPGVTELSACDTLHSTLTCDSFHVDKSSVTVGIHITLGGTLYLVEWMGPGYYLESGLVLEKLGRTTSGLRNQQWFEVYPKQGRIHVSRAWGDADHDQQLSVADTLTLEDGKTLRIREVRLNLRLSPVPPQ